MNVASKLICGIALCVLLGSAHAVGSPQVAMQLNARYSSTPAQCVGRAPAFACSGVLLRAVPASDVETFWKKDDAAQLVFLRKDRAFDGLAAPSGFVLFDRLTAVGLGKPYQADSSAGGVVVSTWNAQVPAQLPIQAIFYDVTRAGALAAAQRSQRAYFDATAQWLPVVRLHLGDGNGLVFGFSQQDQLDNGYRVTRRLNQRYADTRPGCISGRSGFDCNGVLLRSTGTGNFKAWNPAPRALKNGGVSFSYLRSDMAIKVVVWPQGYLIRETAAPVVHTLPAACLYVADGATHDAVSTNTCTFRGWCDEKQPPVNSVATWSASTAGNRFRSCAFRADATALQLMVEIRQKVPGLTGWNEIMVPTWPQDIAAQLPIEAFFFSATAHYLGQVGGTNGLAGGQSFQQDYFKETSRWLPLVKLDVQAANRQPFTYDPAVQQLK